MTNITKFFELEEKLFHLRQWDMKLPKYYVILKVLYKHLSSLRLPCKHYYKEEQWKKVVAKFMSEIPPEYVVAKA